MGRLNSFPIRIYVPCTRRARTVVEKPARENGQSLLLSLYDPACLVCRVDLREARARAHLDTTPSRRFFLLRTDWKGWAERREARHFPDGKRRSKSKRLIVWTRASARSLTLSLSFSFSLPFAFMSKLSQDISLTSRIKIVISQIAQSLFSSFSLVQIPNQI